ncbi:MAG: SulP family inorganic anion transporter [Elusimicrobiota bacterium]
MKIFDKLKNNKNLLTISNWIGNYSKKVFKKDLVAGVTVGIILIPQVMAYAMLAGLPPVYGLYASMIPLIVYTLFGTSKQLVPGIIAIDMIIVATGVGNMASPGTEKYILLVALLALMVGIIHLVMFSAKLGYLVNHISQPVIVGFTMGAALIIIFSQADKILGISTGHTTYIFSIVKELVKNMGSINIHTLIIGGVSLLFLILFEIFKPVFPGSILVIILSTLGVWFFNLTDAGVKIVGQIPAGLPPFKLPSLSIAGSRELMSTAITLAMVQFMSVASLGKIYASKHKYSINSNRELFTIGISNLLNSIFSGMPVSASFSRTAVNEKAGSQTPLANFIAAVVVCVTLLFFTRLFYYLPLAALGAVVVMAAVGLVDFKAIKELYEVKQIDALIAVFTFIVTLVVGIQEGILLGIAVSVLAIFYRESSPNIVELGHLPGTRSYRDVDRFFEAQTLDKILVLRMDASFSFTNAEYFKNFILKKSKESEDTIDAVIIDGNSINDLDTTGLEAIKMIIETLKKWDINFYFAGLRGPVRDILKRDGLYHKMGENQLYRSLHQAISHILKKWDKTKSGGGRYQVYRDRLEEENKEGKTPDGDDYKK